MYLKAACATFLAALPAVALAQRAPNPADATVFIRVVGDVEATPAEDEPLWRQPRQWRGAELGTGSGFFVSPDGLVLTNLHVVQEQTLHLELDGARIKVTLRPRRVEVMVPRSGAIPDGPRRLEATIQASDAELDLAVLYVNAAGAPYLAFGDSDLLEPGAPVRVIGYPFGTLVEVGQEQSPTVVPRPTVSSGTISALRGDGDGETRYLQTDASVNPGNSGGPVVGRDGYVLGVTTLAIEEAAGLGFAIPSSRVRDFLVARGVDQLLPTRFIRAGGVYSPPDKALRLVLPEHFIDGSRSRLTIDTVQSSPAVRLLVNRVLSPWSLAQLENALLHRQEFDQFAATETVRQSPAPDPSTTALAGHAVGRGPDGLPLRMEYVILDLGIEKVVARYLGAADQVAASLGVLRASLAGLDAAPLRTSVAPPAVPDWTAVSLGQARVPLPVPAGWVIEPGGPLPCRELGPPAAAAAVSSTADFTVSMRAALRDSSASPARGVAAACGAPGRMGAGSYRQAFSWLGMEYFVEGAFVEDPAGTVQLEVLVPSDRTDLAVPLLTGWLAQWKRAAAESAR